MTQRVQKPVAWLHTMWMDCQQEQHCLTESPKHPFGIPGWDFSAEFPVTSEPLARMQPKARRPKALKLHDPRKA